MSNQIICDKCMKPIAGGHYLITFGITETGDDMRVVHTCLDCSRKIAKRKEKLHEQIDKL